MTLFITIIVFRGIDNIPQYILTLWLDVGVFKNILWNIVSPTKHCYV